MIPGGPRGGEDHVRDELAAYASGALERGDAAEVTLHLESCERCRRELAAFEDTIAALLELVPEVEPSPGFRARTLAALTAARHDHVPERSPRRHKVSARRLAAVAALVLALGAGVGIGTALAPGRPAGPAVLTASLNGTGGAIGTAVITPGARDWLVMTVDDAGAGWSSLRCVVTLAGGRHLVLGSFSLNNGWGAWSVHLPVAPRDVRVARLLDAYGGVLATARFSA